MEILNELNNNINMKENNFLNSFVGKTINNAIDIGLKTILPDLIEDQIIDIKNALIKNGLKAGVDTAVESTIEFGKSAIGIFTGDFENMSQVRIAISDGGIIDTVSDVLDNVINKTYENGHINKSISSIIKNGKNILLSNISSNIKNKIDEQTNIEETLNRHINNWKEYYNSKDFKGMCKEYNKIEKELNELIPLENISKKIKEVDAIHNLIKNNGQNFEISDLEKELIGKLTK